MQALDALRDLDGGASLAFGFSSVISLSNFYGIEYADFAAETAKLALWIAEYQQNSRFRAAFGTEIAALPLRDSGNILCANSLEVDWLEFCKPTSEEKVYLASNPPYLGATWMSKEQKNDVKSIFSGYTKQFKTLDYVCCWFLKGAEYCSAVEASLAFVSTNTIIQGSHVPILWPIIFEKGIEISFAYTSFKWRNNASHNAGVTCVIIGLSEESERQKYLFNKDGEKLVANNINGYLLDFENIFVYKSNKPLNELPIMVRGNMPYDGGNLLLNAKEKDDLIKQHPEAKKFVRKVLGSNELVKGLDRYCLWIENESLNEASSIPTIRERIEACRDVRINSSDAGARKLAEKPHQFREFVSSQQTLAVAAISSENRPYIPVDVLTSGEITTNKCYSIYDGELWLFSLLVSKLHYIWISTVCVRLEERLSYSNTMGWNTFPTPNLNDERRLSLANSARNILLTREKHYPATIAKLYDSEAMPEDLRTAHLENDLLIESFYRDEPFVSDLDRLAHLFKEYKRMLKE